MPVYHEPPPVEEITFPFDVEKVFDEIAAGDAAEVDGTLLTLPVWLAEQAAYYRMLGTGAGAFLAAELDDLATLAVQLQARTVDAFLGRRAVMEQDRVARLMARGAEGGDS